MDTDKQDTEEARWAVVELMGHVRYGGLVSADNILSTPMLRVDVPQPNGEMATQLVNPSSIYRLTFCEEQIARAAAKQGYSRPIDEWQLRHLLPEPDDEPEEDLGPYDDSY